MKTIEFARLCLEEDAIFRDVTTRRLEELLDSRNKNVGTKSFVIVAKEEGVFSGTEWLEALSQASGLVIEARQSEGQRFKKGQVVCQGTGAWSRVLSTERTLLNELQHLCGIATLTRRYVDRLDQAWSERGGRQDHAKPGLYHTRKTLGLHRDLEIAAVKAGGGREHRRDLAERILFKENHKFLAREAGLEWNEVTRYLAQSDPEALIEVETLDEACVASESGVRCLLLDNFTPEQVSEAVRMLPKDSILEVSGGLRLETLSSYVIPGVSRLSVGALTHGSRSLDLSLDWA